MQKFAHCANPCLIESRTKRTYQMLKKKFLLYMLILNVMPATSYKKDWGIKRLEMLGQQKTGEKRVKYLRTN